MTLGVALQTALSGIQATQVGLSVGSQNVANANTPGYTRKAAEFENVTVAGLGAGVNIGSINRIVDIFLSKALRDQRSDLGAVNASAKFFEQIQLGFGTTASDSTLSADLARLSTTIEALSNLPEDPALRFDVVDVANSLATNIRDLTASIQQLRGDADAQIKDAIDVINRQIEVVADINGDIVAANNVGATVGELEDARDRALSEIAERIDIRLFARDGGRISILTGGGHSLLDTSVNQLIYSPATTFTPTTTFNPITIEPADAVQAVTSAVAVTLVTGGDSSSVVSQIGSGQLKGLLDIRDGTLPNLGDQLDALSTIVRDEFNRIHNRGTGFPPPNVLTGTRTVALVDPFTGTGSVRLAVVDANGDLTNTALDLDLTTVTTVNDLVTALNDPVTGLIGATASVSPGGNLVIAANDPANGISINEDTSQVSGVGFSHFFGLNDLFVGVESSTIAVRREILDNPSLVATARLSLTADVVPMADPTAIAIGDNRTVQELAALSSTAFGFAAVGGLPSGNFTFEEFAGNILKLNSIQAANTAEDQSLQRTLFDDLDFRNASFSGVNVDEELANLITLQNAFNASTRVFSIASEMLEELIDLIS